MGVSLDRRGLSGEMWLEDVRLEGVQRRCAKACPSPRPRGAGFQGSRVLGKPWGLTGGSGRGESVCGSLAFLKVGWDPKGGSVPTAWWGAWVGLHALLQPSHLAATPALWPRWGAAGSVGGGADKRGALGGAPPSLHISPATLYLGQASRGPGLGATLLRNIITILKQVVNI